jgi:hypothetical protein
MRDLFVTDPVADRNALRRRKGNRSPGTFNWLLEADALKTWLGAPKDTSQEDSDILWLYGNPGAGKSTAAITLTEQLPIHPDFINGAKRLAYFFCDSSSEKQRTAVDVLRGLLYQLITQHKALIKYLLPKYAVMGKQIFSSFDALWLVIAEMAACETDTQIYCIIDALDECEPNSQTVLLEQIYRKFNNFDDLDYVLQAKMRILITSRPYHEIRQVLGSFMCKDLASFSEIATDLELMIQEKVGILSKRHRYSKAVATEISLMLQYKAEGTFLWVGIACEELMRVQSMRAVKTLQALPRGLSALYQNLLSTAMSSGDEDDRDFIVKILTWVAYSQRPLTLGELSEACELFPEEDEETRCVFTRDTIDLCRLMVIVQDEHVLLLHTSVKDFLVNSTKEIDFLEANSALSYRCINRLIQSYGSNVAAGDAQFNRGFLNYAVMYWPRHAQLAGSKFGIRQDQAYFFQNHWKNWLRSYQAASPSRSGFDASFSAFHAAVHWSLPQLLSSSIENPEQNFLDLFTVHGLAAYVDANFKDSEGVTPLQEAMRHHETDIICLFLSKLPPGYILEASLVEEVARDMQCGIEIMQLLFKQYGTHIQITEGVVMAAAENDSHGGEIIALLIMQQTYPFPVTEKVLSLIVNHFGKPMVTLLLEHRGEQIQFTEAMLASMVEQLDSTVTTLLLNRCGHRCLLPKRAVCSILRFFDGKVASLLFEKQGEQIEITEDTLVAAARNAAHGYEIMKILISPKYDRQRITGRVFEAAAWNQTSGQDILTLLFRYGEGQVQISQNAVCLIMQYFDANMVALLFAKCGHQIPVTEDVIVAAAKNYFDIERVMSHVIDRWGDQIQITRQLVQILLRKCQRMLQGLLDFQKQNSPDDNHHLRRKIILAALLHLYDILPDSNFNKAVKPLDPALEFLESSIYQVCSMKTVPDYVPTPAILLLIRKCEFEVISCILALCEYRVLVTHDLATALAEKGALGVTIMMLLLRPDSLHVRFDTASLLVICRRFDPQILALLRSKGVLIQSPSVMIAAAAGNWTSGKGMAHALCEVNGQRLELTDAVALSAIGNWRSGEEFLTTLLQQPWGRIRLTKTFTMVVCRHCSQTLVSLLIGRLADGLFKIPMGALATLCERFDARLIAKLLNKCHGLFTISEDMLESAALNWRYGDEVIALLIQTADPRTPITEETMVAAASNWYCGAKILDVLLSRRENVPITQRVCRAAVSNYSCGEAVLKSLLKQACDHHIFITEGILMAAAKNSQCGLKILQLLHDHFGRIPITENLFHAARTGPDQFGALAICDLLFSWTGEH